MSPKVVVAEDVVDVEDIAEGIAEGIAEEDHDLVVAIIAEVKDPGSPVVVTGAEEDDTAVTATTMMIDDGVR